MDHVEKYIIHRQAFLFNHYGKRNRAATMSVTDPYKASIALLAYIIKITVFNKDRKIYDLD